VNFFDAQLLTGEDGAEVDFLIENGALSAVLETTRPG
jgi:hypothetical protein